jgi:hypothetical protein
LESLSHYEEPLLTVDALKEGCKEDVKYTQKETQGSHIMKEKERKGKRKIP